MSRLDARHARALGRVSTLVLAGLLAGCASTNPIGFWDPMSLEIEGDGGDQLQTDVGTMEWDEFDSLHVAFPYAPGIEDQEIKWGGVADSVDGTIAEDWLTPTSPPMLANGSAPENKLFRFYRGSLNTGDAEMARYRGHAMGFEALEANIDGVPVELYFEPER